VATKTKSGALNKHCMVKGCDGKYVNGYNWSKHMKDNHNGLVPLFTACAGDGCNACINGMYILWTLVF
jgi:hypothetical protein